MDKEILEILKQLQQDNKTINTKLDVLTDRQDQIYQVLSGLEHKAEINKSEHDNMANNIVHIMGNIEAIRKDLTHVEITTANNWADIARLKSVK